jgi:hypothetical protein
MSQNAVRRPQTHGHYTLKRAVKELGSRAVDRRTSVGKALEHWRAELVADLGGTDAVSTQQKALIDLCVRTKLLLESLDAWCLKQPSLVNSKRRSVYPALMQRTQLSDALARYLGALGLQRRAKPVGTLASLLNGKEPA